MLAPSRLPRALGGLLLGVALAGLAVALPGVATPAGAQAAPPAGAAPASGAREVPRLALEIYDGIMSPFCPGLLLANCPSPSADSLRTAIAERVERGDTRAEIEAELYATYGEGVRAAPKASGLGLVAWLAPAVVVLVGGLWVALWLRRASARRTARVAAAPPIAPAPSGPMADAARAADLARLDALVRVEGRRWAGPLGAGAPVSAFRVPVPPRARCSPARRCSPPGARRPAATTRRRHPPRRDSTASPSSRRWRSRRGRSRR